MDKTKKIATYGVMAALAMILSYVEMQLPAFVAIPGVKLGLTNIVVLVALYKMGYKSALFINIVRIIAGSLLFGTFMSFAFSFTGGMLSTLVMILLKKSDKFSAVGVSVAGGITHNIGQILAAMLLLNTKAIIWYLPVLWLSGILSGLLIGLIGALIVKRIKVTF